MDKIKHSGVRSFELRVRVGEAVHFIADCACALGWDTLFLIRLKKLNKIIALLVQLSTNNPQPSSNFLPIPESPDFGATTI